MKTAVYTRVSTEKQDLDMQERSISLFLTQRGIMNELRYSDHAYSGKDTDRPGFKSLENDIKQGKIETLIVWKLDRLSRKLKDLISLLDDFQRHNVKIVSVHENIDMTTPHGIAMVHMIGVFAQLERDMGIERTKAGLAAAKARGEILGRPLKHGIEAKNQILLLRSQGFTIKAIKEQTGINVATIHKFIKQERKEKYNGRL